jgi:hypothetical protein
LTIKPVLRTSYLPSYSWHWHVSVWKHRVFYFSYSPTIFNASCYYRFTHSFKGQKFLACVCEVGPVGFVDPTTKEHFIAVKRVIHRNLDWTFHLLSFVIFWNIFGNKAYFEC